MSFYPSFATSMSRNYNHTVLPECENKLAEDKENHSISLA